MCILFIAIKQHPKYPLIIAANRDEFYARPTAVSKFWSDYPDVLAGRDKQSGGTWMGINTQGYLAALTNFRDPKLNQENAPSRGHLVSDYLIKPSTDYRDHLEAQGNQYNGYNLLCGHWEELSVYNNVSRQHSLLSPGYYGLSNAMLDTPWPKLSHGVRALRETVNSSKDTPKSIQESLFSVLADQTLSSDDQLPDTGIGLEFEKALSSIFINLDSYGTRSSTVLMISNTSEVSWLEKSFSSQGQLESEQGFNFKV